MSLIETLVSESRAVLAIEGTAAETSLYGPFEKFLHAGVALLAPSTSGWVFAGQARANEAGIPDFRVHDGLSLKGWVELKAVVGKDLNNLTGHDKKQQDRFVAGLDNLLYATGWQWRLYRHGQQIGRDVVLGPSSMFDPNGLPFTVSDQAATELKTLLQNFAAAPGQSFTKAADAVRALAFRAKALKLALTEVGEAGAGPHLVQLRTDFRALLYKNGLPFTWERFVDSYVQLATFGVLLWRLETGQPVGMNSRVGISSGMHPLLAQCLGILWDPSSQPEIVAPLLEELCITANDIDPALFAASGRGRRRYISDPIVHAYEPFFQQYDPAARESAGVYYTPAEVVSHIVDGVADLLKHSLGRPEGLLDPNAKFLDPATGTGTFLLGLASAVADAAADAGLPVDAAVGEVMTERASAFELFPGPYTVAHQRLEVALKSFGATVNGRLPIYLADTLAAPEAGTLGGSGFGLAGIEIKKEREEADKVKTKMDILVILGNPPYERIRQASGGGLEAFATSLLEQLRLATPIEMRSDLKSTKDLFVAFWLWSLWALQPPALRLASSDAAVLRPPTTNGIIAFITNRTWISGRSLAGLRRLFRQGAREIWVCDLGGDGRGAHGAKSWTGGDANVFSIRTGVAIVWAVFDRDFNGEPEIYYRRIYGKKAPKLAQLAAPFDRSQYEVLSGRDVAPFLPNRWGASPLAASPRLGDLFVTLPETGNLTSRDTKKHSPIGVHASDVYSFVRGTRGRADSVAGTLGEWSKLSLTKRTEEWQTAQSQRARKLPPDPTSLSMDKIRSYAYRPLDYRHLYDDESWIDWPRPVLREVYANDRRVWALVTIPKDHGRGPAVLHVDRLMDQHVFNNRGAKGVYYLWRPHVHGQVLPDERTPVRDGTSCTFAPMVYDWLDRLGRPGQVDDAYDYILAVLSAPDYTARHWQALENDLLRVPLTTDPAVFDSGAALGAELREAWTLSLTRDPAVSWGGTATAAAVGSARHDGPAQEIRFANGRTLSGVSTDVWGFEVSGYRVLPEWWKARSKWTITSSEAAQAMAVVSALRRFEDLAGSLNAHLDSALATAQSLVAPAAAAPLDTDGVDSIESVTDDSSSLELPLQAVPSAAGVDVPSDDASASASGFRPLSSAPLELPEADVEIDLDVEYDEDQKVYLWGILVSDRSTPENSRYISVGDATSDFDELALAQRFLAELNAVVERVEAEERSLHIFHYGAADRTHLQRLLGPDSIRLTNNMTDLLVAVRQNFSSDVGFGLKALAPLTGFAWSQEGASGSDTHEWIQAARAGNQTEWSRLVSYNEDDTRATRALRSFLRSTFAE